MATKSATVYRTAEYSQFRRLDANRDVSEKQVKQIMDSINSVGYVMMPIKVNSKMQVIDGQGRLEALKRLGLPVDYIVDDEAGISQCRALNTAVTAWQTINFIKSFAESGNQSYKYIEALIKAYGKQFPTKSIVSIAIGGYNIGLIREGRATCSEEQYNQVTEFCEETKEIMPLLKGNGTTDRWVMALYFSWCYLGAKRKAFIEKVFAMRAELYPIIQTEQALEVLEKIWNYRNRHKVYLVTEYKKAFDEYSQAWKRKYYKERTVKA